MNGAHCPNQPLENCSWFCNFSFTGSCLSSQMSQICLFFSAPSAATLVMPTHIFPWVMVTAWFPLLCYCFLPVCFPHCSQSGLSEVESGDSWNNSKYLNRADLYWNLHPPSTLISGPLGCPWAISHSLLLSPAVCSYSPSGPPPVTSQETLRPPQPSVPA